MSKKYAVEQKYFNNGNVTCRIIEVDENYKSVSETRKNYDYYVDIFDTRKEAEECQNIALNA